MNGNKKQFFLRLGIVLAFVILFAGIVVLLPEQKPAGTDIELADDSAREAWLSLRGWRVGEPTVTESQLPAEWQTVSGQRWLSVQHEQGFSPEAYAGETVTRWLYPVLNGESADWYAELWLCGDILIGAEVCDAATQLIRPAR